MEKLKSSLPNMVAVLTIIAVIAGAALAAVNAVTAPQIEEINAKNLADGIKAVMCSDDIQVSEKQTIDKLDYYNISDANGKEIGKAVVNSENGFGGPLKVLVGFDNEGTILGYTVLEHAETPGLGAKAGEWFQDKILGKNPSKDNFTVSKDGGDIDAITASTITSRAFLLAIQNAYNKVIAGTDAESGASTQAHKDEGHKHKGHKYKDHKCKLKKACETDNDCQSKNSEQCDDCKSGKKECHKCK